MDAARTAERRRKLWLAVGACAALVVLLVVAIVIVACSVGGGSKSDDDTHFFTINGYNDKGKAVETEVTSKLFYEAMNKNMDSLFSDETPVDEAFTDFISVYNPVFQAVRDALDFGKIGTVAEEAKKVATSELEKAKAANAAKKSVKPVTLEEAQAKATKATHELSEATIGVTSSASLLTKATQDLSKAKQEKEEIDKQKVTEITALESARKLLESKNGEAIETNGALDTAMKTLKDLEKELGVKAGEELTNKVAAARSSVAELETTLRNQKSQVESLQADVDTKTAALTALDNEIKELDEKIKGETGDVTEMQKALEQVKTDKAKAADSLGSARKLLDSKNGEENKTNGDLDTAMKTLKGLEKELDIKVGEELKNNVTKAQSSVAELETTLRNQKSQVESLQADVDTKTAALTALDNKIKELDEKIPLLESAVTEATVAKKEADAILLAKTSEKETAVKDLEAAKLEANKSSGEDNKETEQTPEKPDGDHSKLRGPGPTTP
ncbi:hypothetical protein BgAZ_102850 [Babesia gibsoni]|uniref:Uncharacterized protein n=1 Tax=Babesia gibsoni TaxID=33632 RepID=A0AAD8PFL0_BABGI|nr:hypothetical protein BgAZ_102850 [Babesia gibsoni]